MYSPNPTVAHTNTPSSLLDTVPSTTLMSFFTQIFFANASPSWCSVTEECLPVTSFSYNTLENYQPFSAVYVVRRLSLIIILYIQIQII